MDADFQSIIIERLRKLEETVKPLESSHNELSETVDDLSDKVDEIGIQGFHTQLQAIDKRINELHDVILKGHIQALNSRVDGVQQSILTTNRDLAWLFIEYTQWHFLYTASVRLTDNPSLFRDIEDHINIESARTHQKCADSSTPFDIAVQFRADCADLSKRHGLKIYRSEV